MVLHAHVRVFKRGLFGDFIEYNIHFLLIMSEI